MRRIAKNCAEIKSSELSYGWTFGRQMAKNPAAKREFPDVRREMAADRLVSRSIALGRRGLKRRDPALLRRSSAAMAKALRLGFKSPNANGEASFGKAPGSRQDESGGQG